MKVQRDFRPLQRFFIAWIHLGHWPQGFKKIDFGEDFAEVFEFFEISPESHTDPKESHWPQGVKTQQPFLYKEMQSPLNIAAKS